MNIVTQDQLRAQNFNAVYKTAAFYRRVASEINFDAGGALKELRAAESRMKALQQQENSLDPDAAYKAFIKHQEDAAKAVETEEFDKMEHWTLDDFTQDYAQRRVAISAAKRKVCAEIYPVARKVTLKFCDAVEKYGKSVRESVEKEHKRFNVEYRPDNLTVALSEAAPFLRRNVEGEAPSLYWEAPPSQLCVFLEL